MKSCSRQHSHISQTFASASYYDGVENANSTALHSNGSAIGIPTPFLCVTVRTLRLHALLARWTGVKNPLLSACCSETSKVLQPPPPPEQSRKATLRAFSKGQVGNQILFLGVPVTVRTLRRPVPPALMTGARRLPSCGGTWPQLQSLAGTSPRGGWPSQGTWAAFEPHRCAVCMESRLSCCPSLFEPHWCGVCMDSRLSCCPSFFEPHWCSVCMELSLSVSWPSCCPALLIRHGP